MLPSDKEDVELANHKPRPGSKAMRRERIKQKREAKRLERQAGSDVEDVAGGARASLNCLMRAEEILKTWQVQQWLQTLVCHDGVTYKSQLHRSGGAGPEKAAQQVLSAVPE